MSSKSIKFNALVAAGQRGDQNGILPTDQFLHTPTGIQIRMETTAAGRLRKHELKREAFYFLDVAGNPLPGNKNFASGPSDLEEIIKQIAPPGYVSKNKGDWNVWTVIRLGQPPISLNDLRENWFQNRQQTQANLQNHTDVDMTAPNDGPETEAVEASGDNHQSEGLATAAGEAVNHESAHFEDADTRLDFSARLALPEQPQLPSTLQPAAPTFNQDSFANNQLEMASNIPDELIDPALLFWPNPIPPTTPSQTPQPDSTNFGDVTMTEEAPESAPATNSNAPSVLEPIRQSVHMAALAWLQALPNHVQQTLPNDPLQAFRLALDNCDAIEPWSRYQSLMGAMEAAAEWFPSLPPEILQHLPLNPLEALQSAVMRLTPAEPAAGDVTMTEPANADGMDTAASFEQSRKLELKRLEEWK